MGCMCLDSWFGLVWRRGWVGALEFCGLLLVLRVLVVLLLCGGLFCCLLVLFCGLLLIDLLCVLIWLFGGSFVPRLCFCCGFAVVGLVVGL